MIPDRVSIKANLHTEKQVIHEMKEKGYVLQAFTRGGLEVELHFQMFYWVFIKGDSYLIVSEKELGEEWRWLLEEDGFELLWDSAPSYKAATRYCEEWYKSKRLRFTPVPISLKEASTFINEHHRHHQSPRVINFPLD